MKKSLTPLGETEMEILHVVWKLGRASVSDVHQHILEERKTAYTTVMTIMRNLASKGYLEYEKEGAAYIYTPARPEEEVKHSLLSQMMTKVFKGSPSEMVQTLVKNENLSSSEREKMLEIIDNLKKELKK